MVIAITIIIDVISTSIIFISVIIYSATTTIITSIKIFIPTTNDPNLRNYHDKLPCPPPSPYCGPALY